METLVCVRDGCSSLVRIIAGKFLLFSSFRNIYILDAYAEELKICIKYEELSHSFDLFYASSGIYICYATDSGSLYALSAPFLSPESISSERSWKLMKPVYHKRVWRSSSTFELISIDSKNEMIWLIEYLVGHDKILTCYHIRSSDDKLTLHLLWIYNHDFSEPIQIGKNDFSSAIRSFVIISNSTLESLLLVNEESVKNDKHLRISDSLFVNLFGSQNNLEHQLINVMCFPDGVVRWFHNSHCMASGISVEVLWNLREEVVNIHNMEVTALSKRGISEKIDCLIVVGKSGTILVFGMQKYPAHAQFKVYCQINSSDVFNDNLLFSTSSGICVLCLSNILKDRSIVTLDKVTPNLISHYKVSSFRLHPDIRNKESIKVLACLPDGRVVTFPLSLSQGEGKQLRRAARKPKKIKQILSSIGTITTQNIEIKKSCDVLSEDFSNLCIATNIYHNCKSSNSHVSLHSSNENNPIKVFTKIDFTASEEYRCISSQERIYSATINCKCLDQRLKYARNSCIVQVVPSHFSDEFPKSLSKSARLEAGTSNVADDPTLKCSITFALHLSPNTLPLNITIFMLVEFHPESHMFPLLIPLKKFEAGILKFYSPLPQHTFHACFMNINDLLRSKMSRSSISRPLNAATSFPDLKLDFIQILLEHPDAPKCIAPTELWETLLSGNKHFCNMPTDSNIAEFCLPKNVHLKLQFGTDSMSRNNLTIHSTSMQVLSLVHREILLIIYRAGYFAIPKKSIFPILEADDIEEPPMKLIGLDSSGDMIVELSHVNSDADDLQRLSRCYRMHRNS